MKRMAFIFTLFCFILSPFYANAANTTDVVAMVEPSVVYVKLYNEQLELIGSGSGFFINEKGDLITNKHVLKNYHVAIAETNTGKRYSIKEIIGKHPDLDLVCASTNATEEQFLDLSPKLAQKGEKITVFGNPIGLKFTVTEGIVSAYRDSGDIMQFTAPVSSGSSGGPIVNDRGHVVGVTMATLTVGQNLNLAIPANHIYELIDKNGQPLFNRKSLDGSIRPGALSGMSQVPWGASKSEALSIMQKNPSVQSVLMRTKKHLFFRASVIEGYPCMIILYFTKDDMFYAGCIATPIDKQNYKAIYQKYEDILSEQFDKFDVKINNADSKIDVVKYWNFDTNGKKKNYISLSLENMHYDEFPNNDLYVTAWFVNGELRERD